jgi:hypothetical protein
MFVSFTGLTFVGSTILRKKLIAFSASIRSAHSVILLFPCPQNVKLYIADAEFGGEHATCFFITPIYGICRQRGKRQKETFLAASIWLSKIRTRHHKWLSHPVTTFTSKHSSTLTPS